jgi:hypothetical protein
MFFMFKMNGPSVSIQGEPRIMSLSSENKYLIVNFDTKI